MHHSPDQTFSRRIESFFGQGRCFLLARGRVGLYAGLKAMNPPRGAEVVLPGYTCMVVPAAIKAAGLKPVYVDIDPQTYNLDPALLDSVDARDARALIVQHTYGIPCSTAAMDWAWRRSLPVIEDCCHSFGSRLDGRLCGTLGAFAFMSGQWNKPFSTGLGGMLLVSDPHLADRAEQLIGDEARPPGALRNLWLKAQIVAHAWLVGPRTAARMTKLYRALTRTGLTIGSSSAAELDGEIPEGYFSTMAPCQVRQGLREMARIEENLQHRRQLAAWYGGRLAEIGFAPLELVQDEELPLLRYPVRVANKQELLARAEEEKLELGSWFESPLHPAGTRLEDFDYRPGVCPQAEAASREVVNLPTHRKIDEATAERTLQLLRRYGKPA